MNFYRFNAETKMFFQKHPQILETITLQNGAGSFFNHETGRLNVGVRRPMALAHELSHIIVANEKDLFSVDFGSPIAAKYPFEKVKEELAIFRAERCLDKLLNIEINVQGSIGLMTSQIDKDTEATASQKIKLYISARNLMLMPISQEEIDYNVSKLLEKISYLQQFVKKETAHFEFNVHKGKALKKEEEQDLFAA